MKQRILWFFLLVAFCRLTVTAEEGEWMSGMDEVKLAALLESGADINEPDCWGETPLHRAVAEFGMGLYHDHHLLEFLLEHGADPNARDGKGRTPMHHIWSLDPYVVELLLQHGGDVTLPDKEGETPLDVVRKWAQETGAASSRETAAMVQAYASTGELPQPSAREKAVAAVSLEQAVSRGHLGLIRLHLERGADINAPNECGRRLLGIALGAEGAGPLATMRFLLQHGAQVRECPSVLLPAVYHGAEVVGLLLEHGADPRVAYPDGTTPLHNAATWGDVESSCLLLAHGADVNARTDQGLTPLGKVDVRRHPEAVMCLAGAGADVNVYNEEGFTPLMLAAAYGDADLVALLLDHGADIHATDRRYGDTALHKAAALNCLENAKLLLSRGADPHARNHAGATPADEAATRGHEEMAKLISENP